MEVTVWMTFVIRRKEWAAMWMGLRFVIIPFATFGTMLVATPENDTLFALCNVFYLGLAGILDKARDKYKKGAGVLLLLESTASCMMTVLFEGIMYLLFCSTLLALHQSRLNQSISKVFLILMAMLNVCMFHYPPETILLANFIMIIMVVILRRLDNASTSYRETEKLYDELRKKHYDLEHARLTILDYAKQVEFLTQIEERNRIANDLHDDLGHAMIRMKMMMEAAIATLHTDQQRSLSMLAQVQSDMAKSMDTLRRTVRRIKPDAYLANQFSLEKLADDMGNEWNIEITYSTSGIPYATYPSEDLVFYRNAKEAIINAVRHAGASKVSIHLRYEPDQMTMSVTNDGTIPDLSSIRKGVGITGMEERASLLGGRILMDCGEFFTIHTIIPRNHSRCEENAK
jgi:signal transduction histidine kinase